MAGGERGGAPPQGAPRRARTHVFEEHPWHGAVVRRGALQQAEHVAHEARGVGAGGVSVSGCGAAPRGTHEMRTHHPQAHACSRRTGPSRPRRRPARETSMQGNPAASSSVSCRRGQGRGALVVWRDVLAAWLGGGGVGDVDAGQPRRERLRLLLLAAPCKAAACGGSQAVQVRGRCQAATRPTTARPLPRKASRTGGSAASEVMSGASSVPGNAALSTWCAPGEGEDHTQCVRACEQTCA